MPIPLPVTRTRIATVPWGIPITNEVNRLSGLADARTTIAAGTCPVGAQSFPTSPTTIASLAIQFTAKANRVYLVYTRLSLVCTSATFGNIMYVTPTGWGPGANMQISATAPGSTWGFFVPFYGIACKGMGTQFSAGVTIVGFQMYSAALGLSAQAGNWPIGIIDLGPDV